MGGVPRRGSQDLKARWWGQAPSVTPSPRRLGSWGQCLTQPLSVSTPPPSNRGPPPSFREEEQGSQPGAECSRGTMHHVNTAWATGLCQSRRRPTQRGAHPKFRAKSAPDCSPKPHGLRERKGAGSSDGLPGPLVLTLPGSSTLRSPPSPLCELLMSPVLPARRPLLRWSREGGRPCLQQLRLCPQKAACTRPAGLARPCARPWPRGWRTSPPGGPAWVSLGEGATGRGPGAWCGDGRLAQSWACAGCRALAPT